MRCRTLPSRWQAQRGARRAGHGRGGTEVSVGLECLRTVDRATLTVARRTVARLTMGEVEALAADLRADLGAWTASTPQARSSRHLDDIESMLNNATWNHHIELRVAALDGRRVGIVATRASAFAGEPSSFVWWIAVDPDVRRRGVGRALAAAIEDDARTQGRILEGLVSADDPAAVAFWTALGWSPTGTDRNAPWVRDPRAAHGPAGER